MRTAATIAVATILWWLLAGGESAATIDTLLCVLGIITALIIAVNNQSKRQNNES